MDEAEHYELDDSDVEAAMPPRDLLQTAREILARPLSLQVLARAWDRSNHLPTEEQRVGACLERLLTNEVNNNDLQPPTPPRPARAPAAATSSPVQAPPRKTSTPTSTPARATPPKRVVIDLSEDTPPVYNASASSRKRPRNEAKNDDDGFILEIPPPAAKVSKTSSTTSSNKCSDDAIIPFRPEELDPLPDWLLQEFAANAAAPGPAAAPAHALAHPAARQPSPIPRKEEANIIEDEDEEEELMSENVSLPEEPAFAEPEILSPLAQVLAIIPDVDPVHAQQLIEAHSSDPATCVEHVIEALFAKSYPKAQSSSTGDKGKGKANAQAENVTLVRLKAYLDKDTRTRTEGVPSFTYREAALEYLYEEFDLMPLPFIRNVYAANNFFWAPSFIELTRMSTEAELMYKPLSKPRKSKGKGGALQQDAMLTAERACYAQKVARDKAEEDAKLATELEEQEEIARGQVFECGCCFDDVPMSKMIPCSEAHLFCVDCARKNAEHTLGNRGSEITCMDQDGCTAPFSDAVLTTFLKTPQMLLLEKIRSEKAVEAAGLAGMSFCPHCSFGCVIDNPDEKLFYCLNEECKKITCRNCQKPDHLPKSCEEYAADLKTDTIHKVEEAMTEALLKRCPKCTTAILKEDGCNKMRCSKCNLYFCYVCGIGIGGYEHFDQRAGGRANPAGKCKLWDDTRTKEYEEVEAARMRAIAAIREEKGDPDAVVTDEELAKLGLEKPEPKLHPGQHHIVNRPIPQLQLPAAGQAVPPLPGANQYRYRYPMPLLHAGAPVGDYQAQVAHVMAHNALLDGVNGDWNAYIAEHARVRRLHQQGDHFLAPGDAAARIFVMYMRVIPDPAALPPLPAPIPMFVPAGPQALPAVAPPHPIPPAAAGPFPAPVAPAVPAIPAPRARRVGKKARA